MPSKLPSKMPATERQLRAIKHFNKSTSRIGQCNKVAGYPRYLAKVGDGDHYTNLWKMLQDFGLDKAGQAGLRRNPIGPSDADVY